MATDHRTKLAGIKTLTQLIAYLRDEMNWPIAQDSFEEVDDLFYDFTADELGIDPKTAAKIESIKRLRPLSVNQPWGIFFVKFEPKKLPVVALRRILGQVALKKRPSANSAERAAWAADDLLFISNYGEGSERQITFAHFAKAQGGQNLPTLKVLGWDNRDTALHLDAVAKELTEHLAWPADDSEAEAWRAEWRGAFTLGHGEVITTSKQLSIRLAGLARDIRDRIQSALRFETDRGPLTKLMKAFQTSLVHDLKPDDFADMYAQTIAYGLLSARIADPHKKTVDDFAGHMRTNPFLRELMETFLKVGGRRGKAGGPGIDFDELGVNEVVELLDDANMEAVVVDFGDKNPQEDPVIHFYQDFLQQYDAKKRVQRGVYYTPRPVVSYIVRSVDELLRTEFGLEDGLADTTTWGEMAKRNKDLKIPEGTSPEQAFVQILDPATGTGTFLVEVIDIIHKTMVAKWKAQVHGEKKIAALWNEYVPEHLLKRLHAYELLMAPYAIAHLKVGLKLYETGYRFDSDERARIYLTNALEPAQDFSGTLEFAIPALAHEAQAVNAIKAKQRFTVVLGNPPYSGHSANASKDAQGKHNFIGALLQDYYSVDGAPLGERNPKWLQDDYVKFVRLGQHFLGRSGSGTLAFITNHGYLDNPTFRGMRSSLLHSFGGLFFLDLHGNIKKKEVAPGGSKDENVFEIQQGVAIGLLVNCPLAPTPIQRTAACCVRHADLFGSRERKYEWLSGNSSTTGTQWTRLEPARTRYLFRPQDTSLLPEYELGWPVQKIFPVNAVGFQTHRDYFVLDMSREDLLERISDFADPSQSDSAMRNRYFSQMPASIYPRGDTRDWKLADSRKTLKTVGNLGRWITECLRRPFDFQYYFFHPSAIDYGRPEVMGSLINHENVALLWTRPMSPNYEFSALVASVAVDQSAVGNKSAGAGGTYVAPLYQYPLATPRLLSGGEQTGRRPNLSKEFILAMTTGMKLAFLPEATGDLKNTLGPEDIVHYIYAVFYSPSYRSRYAEFLKTDFARVPLPGSIELYRALSRVGGKLVALHLMKAPELSRAGIAYTGPRNPEVGRVGWAEGRVWLDAAPPKQGQHATPGTIGFHGVSEAVWNFHIGGYQVCEKWLKDRKGRTLSKDDIAHYQKIVVAISETIRLMKEIDEVIEQHGGWPGAFQTGEALAAEPDLQMVAEPEAKYGSDEDDDPEGGAEPDQGRISFQ